MPGCSPPSRAPRGGSQALSIPADFLWLPEPPPKILGSPWHRQALFWGWGGAAQAAGSPSAAASTPRPAQPGRFGDGTRAELALPGDPRENPRGHGGGKERTWTERGHSERKDVGTDRGEMDAGAGAAQPPWRGAAGQAGGGGPGRAPPAASTAWGCTRGCRRRAGARFEPSGARLRAVRWPETQPGTGGHRSG